MRVFFFFFMILPLTAFSQSVTIAEWNFEDQDNIADVFIAANSNAEVVRDQADPSVSVGYYSGYESSFAIGSNRFHKFANDQFWKITISTSGYSNLTFSSRQSGTATGSSPRDFKLQYSLDDSNWIDVPGGAVLIEGDWVGGMLSDLALPAECNDLSVLHLRLLRVGDVGISGSTIAWNSVSYLDNLIVKGDEYNANDADSELYAGADTEPSQISSVENSADGLQVLDFTFEDMAAGDMQPTIIDGLSFSPGSLNELSDWTEALAGAKLFGPDIDPSGLLGTINSQSIVFSSDGMISVADGTAETYQLNVWLQTDLSAVPDNSIFEFLLDYTAVITDNSGSYFGSGSVESGSISLDVEAVELQFAQIPAAVAVNTDFSVSLAATDAHGNIDTDETSLVALSVSSGSGTLSSLSGLSLNLNGGILTWSDLQYDTIEEFTLQAEASGLSTVISAGIVCAEMIFHLNDDFEDGDIAGWQESSPGRWAASLDEPLNGSYSLKHSFDNPDSDTDVLAHPLNNVDLTQATKVWRFRLKYPNSDPSSNNFWAVVLGADGDESAILSDNFSGYVLGVNFNASDDLVKLWTVTNGSPTELITTDYNWKLADASIQKGFEVSRTPAGDWELKIDDNGGFDGLISYGTATDNSFTSADYFGIFYKYSSTMDQLLTMDDIYFGPEIPDTEAPQLMSLTPVSPSELELVFNEELEIGSAENVENYFADNALGTPELAVLQADNRTASLSFSDDFTYQLEYVLTINGVEDLSGNVIENSEHTFTWIELELTTVSVVSDTELLLEFSKSPSPETAENTANYTADNGLGNPSSAVLTGDNNSQVLLTFAQPFAEQQNYLLTVENLEDVYGNLMPAAQMPFLYYLPAAYDVVVNEIMCDINPLPQALPPYKYVELYNRSAFEINFSGWTFQIDDNTAAEFPPVSLAPGDYLILCEADAETAFQAYGQTVPMLSESQLTVSGKPIYIRDADSNLIEYLSYTDNWYGDTDKDDGGWSLERIDYENFCGEEANWHASENITGGTPGLQNSVYAENPDNSQPEITGLSVISSKELRLIFSEKPDEESALSPENYTVNSSVNPVNVYFDPIDVRAVYMVFENNFPEGNNVLDVSGISDPCGNIMQPYTGDFLYELIYPYYAQAVSDHQLKLYFSEKPNAETAQNTTHYSVNNSIGNPQIAQVSNTDSSIIYLTFEGVFAETQPYIISISDVSDINANVMQPADLEFVYYLPKPFDVVFSEIMSDVNPAPNGLPAVKYVELFNTSDYDLDVSDWIFQAEGQSERIFPAQIIPTGGYLVLSEESGDFGEASVLDLLGSSDLSTSGKTLYLSDANGNLIQELSYTDEWYGESGKDGGGWSLEVVDPYNFCQAEQNWLPSEDPAGGTPGRLNSVDALNPDTEIPAWDTLHIISANTLDLYFSEELSFESFSDTANYLLNSEANPLYAERLADKKVIRLSFAEQFSDGEYYELSVMNLADNCGNVISEQVRNFTYHRIYVENMWIEEADHLVLDFSEAPEYLSAVEPLNYTLNPSSGYPEYVFVQNDDSARVHLLFDAAMPQEEELTFSVNNLYDRNANQMAAWDTSFTYRTAGVADVIINEVLFNPYSGGADFVELYNRSYYDINLKHLKIARREADGNIDESFALSEDHLYMAPGEYRVYTDGRELVLRDYYSENPDGIVELSDFPTLTNTSSTVVLLGMNDSIIDEFTYDEDMHYPLLADVKGVSLERIDPDGSTQSADNWHSAAETVGFATPAYKNSQQIVEIGEENSEVWLEPEIFSPDQDGIDDFMQIHYAFEEGGYTATVIVFNAEGRQMRILENNLLLSAEGSIKWDGLYEDGSLMRSGIYIIYFKAFKPDGTIKEYKKVVTLAVKY